MHKAVNTNNDELMQDFRQGMGTAFDDIFRDLYPALCYYGFTITRDKAVSEDIAGESFVKIWERKPAFTHFLSLKSYLYTTVKNASLDWLKKSKTHTGAVKAMAPELTEESKLELLVTAETYRELHLAIEELPAQCGKVMDLYYLKGKKLREIAGELHIDISSVKTHKTRGILLLRKRLRYFLAFLF